MHTVHISLLIRIDRDIMTDATIICRDGLVAHFADVAGQGLGADIVGHGHEVFVVGEIEEGAGHDGAVGAGEGGEGGEKKDGGWELHGELDAGLLRV